MVAKVAEDDLQRLPVLLKVAAAYYLSFFEIVVRHLFTFVKAIPKNYRTKLVF